jgi:hypothetical protein
MENKLSQEELFNDGKYKMLAVTNGEKHHRKLSCKTDGVCIIPFEVSGDNISKVYLSKSTDYSSAHDFNTCITFESTHNEGSEFAEVSKGITDALGLEDVQINTVFFLGKIKHNFPFSKSYRCYGIKMDRYIQHADGFNLENEKIEKVDFNKVVSSGDVHDSLCLSASLLLISYLK